MLPIHIIDGEEKVGFRLKLAENMTGGGSPLEEMI